MDKPLVDKNYLLEKFPGKGGWTNAAIPEILQNKNNPFGWVTVKGSIDSFKIHHFKLMPMVRTRILQLPDDTLFSYFSRIKKTIH
ncbi:DUF1905 domain-containing protein [Flavobacterium faecale]|uniref:DUF1905 domain-containing protein n=1 Tax=Flavobacterium faecale TaxID=1355330 RepID=UPI003AAAF4E6